MTTQDQHRRELPSTYFVQDRENMQEVARQHVQGQIFTASMGGALPEQPDPTIFRRVLDVGLAPTPTIQMAVAISRPGGIVGFVGAPHGQKVPLGRMFSSNIGLRGGLAPARAYLPELLAEILAGRLDPSPVLDLTVSLAEIASGYRAMDQRQAIKVMVRP